MLFCSARGCYALCAMHRRDLLKVSPLALGAAVGHVSLVSAQTSTHSAEAVYNVRDFGAAGDGKTVDTQAINNAIEAVAAKGGGTLVFPAGTYMCFTIHLKSHVDLYLSHGCTIQAADSPKPGETTGYNGGTYDAAGAIRCSLQRMSMTLRSSGRD
jgi:polygalacturonase